MTNTNSSETGTKFLPMNVSNSLPIFKFLGNDLPESMKTPETKRAFGKIAYTGITLLIGYIFYLMLPWLISTTKMLVILGILITLIIILWNVAPHVIRYLNNVTRTYSEKLNRSLKENNSIEWLYISFEEAQKVFNDVRSRITRVDGIVLNMTESAEIAKTQASSKLKAGETTLNEASEMDKKAQANKDNEQLFRKYNRLAKEARAKAETLKSEVLADQDLAGSYAQYANEFGKASEILKDNESDAKMFINALASSIKIIESKMKATTEMRKATEGLADLFEFPSQGDFDIAMNAARYKINDNLANIRRNLDYVDENRLSKISGTKSQEELQQFFSGAGLDKMKKLDIEKITDPQYQIPTSEKSDKTFSIFDK